MIPTKDEIVAAANAAAEKYNVKHKVAYRSGWLDAVEYLQQKLQQTHVVGSGDGFPDEDDEDFYNPEPECQSCGQVEGHLRGCPEDESPFAQLIRDGYD